MLWIILLVWAMGLFYWAFIKPMYYWSNRNVTQGPIVPIFGNSLFRILRIVSFPEMIKNMYNRYPNERYTGFYQTVRPILMIRDLELIKQITIKDFDHFMNHLKMIPEDVDPIWEKNLFILENEKWRDMRAILSPAFTSSKMRTMFCLINECGEQFTNYYLQQESDKEIVLELKDAFTRQANDVIASCAFGIKVDSLKERNNEFYTMGKEVTDFSGFFSIIVYLSNVLCPRISKMLKLQLFSDNVSIFFRTLISDTLKIREEQKIVRPDMINLLMEARKGRLKHQQEDENVKDSGFATTEESHIGKVDMSHRKGEITDTDITAQALAFFFAGFNTVSTLMCFMAYELACNPDIQARLFSEVSETEKACGGKLTYDSLANMKYMDMVITESLRKWPGAATERVCVKPYTIKPTTPNESPVHIKVGDSICIPIMGIHHDEKYYPEPDRFDPERFNEDNKKNIRPSSFLTFGIGPRNCIGSRFALMETKTTFFHILSKFEITVVEKTPIPIKICKKSFSIGSESGFWLGMKPRKSN